jgi:CTP:molybdopterin cytidylyltransferase MocA
MGKPKALLDAGGESFLSRILSSLEQGGAEPLIVVVRAASDPVALEAERCAASVILNSDPSPGPVSSLQCGIRSLPEDVWGLLYAPVDHPLFSPDTVRQLIGTSSQANAPLVVPAFDGRRGHPVLFGRAVFQELMEETLPEGARTVVRRYLEARIQLDVDDPGILVDIDTPEEYWKHFRLRP